MRRAGGAQTSNQVGCLTHIIQVFERNRSLPGVTEQHLRIIDDRIQKFRADLDLYLGKRRLEEKQYATAKEHLKLANAYFNRPKLQFILMLLSVAPPLVRALNNLRNKAQSPA